MTLHIFLKKGICLQNDNFRLLTGQYLLQQPHRLINGLIGFSTGKARNTMTFPQFHRGKSTGQIAVADGCYIQRIFFLSVKPTGSVIVHAAAAGIRSRHQHF